jgi:hypothetical protein
MRAVRVHIWCGFHFNGNGMITEVEEMLAAPPTQRDWQLLLRS